MKKLLIVIPALACLLGCPDKPAASQGAPEPSAEGAPAEAAWTDLEEGLRYQELVVGSGPEVKWGDTVLTHATGTFPDGKKFWSSLDDGKKVAFPIKEGSVILGWVRGVPGMKAGGKRKLFVPWQLAYGEAGRPPEIPAKADLVFEIEVFEIQ